MLSQKRDLEYFYDPKSFCGATKRMDYKIKLKTYDIQFLQKYCDEKEWYTFFDDDQNKWGIELDPFFDDDKGGYCYTIYVNLELLSHKQKNVLATFCLPQFNKKSDEIEQPHDFIKQPKYERKCGFDAESTGFTLICRIELKDSSKFLASCKTPIGDDYGTLYESGIYSDVDGREFKTHKNILTARSDVFAAMFQHDMAEKKSNRVDITDVKANVADEMFRFIYSGNSPNIKEMAADLLHAAEKYALKELTRICTLVLMQDTTYETAEETLALADRYNIEHLKIYALKFIQTSEEMPSKKAKTEDTDTVSVSSVSSDE